MSTDENTIDSKFLYYCLSSYYLKTGKYERHFKYLKEIEIPIISMEEQKAIVAVLDRFYVLVNDLNIGLPAEIEARQKQYEYYRDKLLTFKEKQ